jgi:hypothetical protein
MRIATGQIEEKPKPKNAAAAELGSKGGKARASSLSKRKRVEIARKAAAKRWEGLGGTINSNVTDFGKWTIWSA